MADKVRFGERCKALGKVLGDAATELEMLSHLWASRGYASGGADEIVQDDLENLDLTPADLAVFITFINNFMKFLDMDSPTNNDYRQTIDLVRDL